VWKTTLEETDYLNQTIYLNQSKLVPSVEIREAMGDGELKFVVMQVEEECVTKEGITVGKPEKTRTLSTAKKKHV
jgi:hypothetical protein